MTTITMMERTATGWGCKACGFTVDDGILPTQWAAHECDGVNRAHAATPREGWVTEATAGAVERERLEAMAATAPEVLAAEVGVPLRSAAEAIDAARSALDAATGVLDAFRYGPVAEAIQPTRGMLNVDTQFATVVTMTAKPKPLVCHAPGVSAGVKAWEDG